MKIEYMTLEEASDYLVGIPSIFCVRLSTVDERWLEVSGTQWQLQLYRLYHQKEKCRLLFLGTAPSPTNNFKKNAAAFHPQPYINNKFIYLFDEFFEAAPSHIQNDLVFHLDMFR